MNKAGRIEIVTSCMDAVKGMMFYPVEQIQGRASVVVPQGEWAKIMDTLRKAAEIAVGGE